jgi:hypothetical protein
MLEALDVEQGRRRVARRCPASATAPISARSTAAPLAAGDGGEAEAHDEAPLSDDARPATPPHVRGGCGVTRTGHRPTGEATRRRPRPPQARPAYAAANIAGAGLDV